VHSRQLQEMSSTTPPSIPDRGPSATLRSTVSLFLVIHFFCVLVVLAATNIPSRLQLRLVAIFAPYTELLALDPGPFSSLYLTHGGDDDEDAILVIDLYPSGELPVSQQQLLKTVTLPSGGSPWLGERQRAIALARQLARDAEDDDLSAEITKPVGARVMRENNARRAVVRCVRRLSQPLRLETLYREFPADNPTAAAYDRVMYEADVWIDEDGRPQAQRRVAAAEAAPRRTAPPRNQGLGVGGQGSQDSGQGAPP
jgi:hypothetical protein